jgi:hypothetical protein
MTVTGERPDGGPNRGGECGLYQRSGRDLQPHADARCPRLRLAHGIGD